jgi:hypothetical protein
MAAVWGAAVFFWAMVRERLEIRAEFATRPELGQVKHCCGKFRDSRVLWFPHLPGRL